MIELYKWAWDNFLSFVVISAFIVYLITIVIEVIIGGKNGD